MTGAAQHEAPRDLVQLSEDSIERGSKSFAAAARLFAPDTRKDAVMLYAWCRHADDLIDGQTLGHDQRASYRAGQRDRLQALREATEAALDGAYAKDEVFEALHRVVEKHQIPHRHPLELVRGFEMDAEGRVYDTLDDTLDYCYHVAGVVGVMMSMIMGARDKTVLDRASDLGIAFQLTNIARDVVDDARVGRVYLPARWLNEAGLSVVQPDRQDHQVVLHSLAMQLLDHAEPHYTSAYKGIASLPWRSAWAIAAARRVYRDIGEKLRSDGPAAWQGRVVTTKARKIWLLVLSLKDVVITRFARVDDAADRVGLYQRPS
jgi:phytoene synthase